MEPTSGNQMVNAIVLVFTLIAGLVVVLRLFTRGLILRKTGLEDVFISVAMVFAVGLAVTIAVQIMNGLGLHIYEIPPDAFLISQKAFWGSIWIYNLSLTLTKLSILVQYLTIFPNPHFRLTCYIAIGVVSVWGVWTLFGSIFICTPVAFFWDKSIPDGVCLNRGVVWFMNGAVNIVQDFILLAMPIAVLRSLDIPSRQKKALIIVFAFGTIVCIVSIIRLHTLVAISNSTDPTYDNLAAAMLSAIEVNVGIVCACLPSMRPLFSAIMPTYFPSSAPPTSARRTYDEERVKDLRMHSAVSVPYPVRIASKGHSRSGSNGSQLRTPMSVKSSHSSLGGTSRPYTPQSARYTHSGTGSAHSLRSREGTELSYIQRQPSNGQSYLQRAHSRTKSEPLVRSHPSTRSHSRNGSQPALDLYTHSQHSSTASVHHQHKLHPLRMQPARPETPRLPRLPEDMSAFDDPFQRPARSPLGPPHTPRRMVFHKPLPITPYPILMS